MKRLAALILIAAVAVMASGCCCLTAVTQERPVNRPAVEAPDMIATYAPETYATVPAAESWFYDGYTLYNNGDGYQVAWITFYTDYSFEMTVNLYEGYGLCTGYYEVRLESGNAVIYCTIEDKDFSGFAGDHIENFYLVQVEDGSYYVELVNGEYMGAMFNYTYFAE